MNLRIGQFIRLAAIVASFSACSPDLLDRFTPAPPVSSDKLEFGQVTVGAYEVRTLTISNRSSAERSVGFWVRGADASDFAGPIGAALAPGASRTVSVAFQPAAAGPRVARLEYAIGDQRGSISLEGIGVRVELEVEPALDFGIATEGATLPLVLRNVTPELPGTDADQLRFAWQPFGSDGSWTPVAPTLGGPQALEFAVEWPPEAFRPEVGLAPGEELTVKVRFAPTSPGRKTATLTFVTSDASRPKAEVAVTAEFKPDEPCDWVVDADELEFAQPLGRGQRESFRITNRGARACRIVGIQLAEGSSPAFSVPALTELAIAAGGTAEVPVVFEPTVAGDAFGYVAFRSGARVGKVALYGSGHEPLVAAPAEVDFGDSACGGRRTLSLYNTGPVAVRVDSIRLVGSAALSVDEAPAVPKLVHPGDALSVTIRYGPAGNGEDVASLLVQTDSHTTAIPVAARSTGPGPRTDVVEISPIPPLDVLFIIDDSPSMAGKQQAIASNLGWIFNALEDQAIDYRIAVTTTGVDAANGGTGSGPGFSNGRFLPLTGSGPRVITPSTPDKALAFARNVAVGAATSCDGFLIRPARLALSEPLLSTHNAGFLRDEANLMIVLVTDGADRDPEALIAYQAFLRGLKQRTHSVTFNAVMPTVEQVPQGCSYDEPGSGRSPRVRDLVARTWGLYDEICAPDWGKTFGGGGITIPTPFWVPLSNKPDLSVGPEPIVVAIDGVEIDALGPYGEERWTYQESSNAIVFGSQPNPGPGTRTTVTYTANCR